MQYKVLDKSALIEKAKKTQLSYVQEELCNVKLLDSTKVQVGTEHYDINNQAFDDLCHLISMPAKFFKDMKQIDGILLEQVSVKMREAHNSVAIFCVTKQGTIIAVRTPKASMVTNVDFVDHILNTSELDNCQLRNFSITPSGVSASFVNPGSEFNAFKIGSGADLYRSGLNFLSSQTGDHASYVNEVVDRMVCSNLTYANISEHSHAIRLGKRNYNDILGPMVGAWLRDSKPANVISNRVTIMRSTNASYAECASAYGLVKSLKDENKRCVITDVDENIPIHSIAAAYGYEHPIDRSPGFKRTAATPINYYDLFNYVTNVGTHHPLVPMHVRDSFLIRGGTMMVKTPDLLDVAPSVQFA